MVRTRSIRNETEEDRSEAGRLQFLVTKLV